MPEVQYFFMTKNTKFCHITKEAGFKVTVFRFFQFSACTYESSDAKNCSLRSLFLNFVIENQSYTYSRMIINADNPQGSEFDANAMIKRYMHY